MQETQETQETQESKDTLFFTSKVKIERAKQYVRELGEEAGEYLKSKPFRVVVERDPDSENNIWRLKEKNEVPEDLSEIAGNTIRNLIVALDLLATEVVSLAEGKLVKITFPFAEDADDLEKIIKLSHIDRAGEDVAEVFRSLKPYKGGNKLLMAIHELDEADEQEVLAPSLYYTGIHDFQKMRISGPLQTVEDAHCGPIKDGMVIASLPPVSKARPGKVFNPSLKVSFDGYPLFKDKEIGAALTELISATDEVIGIFTKHIENKGA